MFGLPEEKTRRRRKPDSIRARGWNSDAERKATERRAGRDLIPPPVADLDQERAGRQDEETPRANQ